MANTKISALNTTTNSDWFLPIVLTAWAPASKINLRDAINAIASWWTEYKWIFDWTTETNLPAWDKWDMYIVSNSWANPETVNWLTLYNWDWIICNTDWTVAWTPANRDVVHPDTIPDASETTKWITQYATLLETEAKIINNKAVVPSALTNFVLNTELVNQEDVLQTYRVQLFFDDWANDLPWTTSTQIDWETVSDKDLVYVVDCSDWTKIDKVYEATVIWANINWTYKYTVWTNSIYSEWWTVYWDKVYMDSNVAYYFSDLYATTVNATDITTENITITKTIDADHYNFQYDVNLVFDDWANSLPLDTSTQIDWQTIVDWNLVYVKDSATASQIWKIYIATVSWTSIVWTEFATLKNWDTYYSQGWDIYWDTINNYDNTTTNNFYNISTLSIVNINSNSYNANYNTFNIVKFATWNVNLNFPTAVWNAWKIIRIKHLKWNDTYTTTIIPDWTETIDWYTSNTFQFDEQEFWFISNWVWRNVF